MYTFKFMDQQTITVIKNHLENNFSLYMNMLKQMVDINSYTENASGVNRLASYLAKIHKKFGFTKKTFTSQNPDSGNHLLLEKKGLPGLSIVCLLHLDTVFSKQEETINRFYWKEDGDKIYGPGTNDMKGGILVLYMMLDVLATLFPEFYRTIHWRLLFNASEETNSDDFAKICRQEIPPDSLACLVFEAGKKQNNDFPLVTARKGRAVFRLTTTGNSVHSGVNHQQGANAISQLADVILRVHQLTDYDTNLTVNIGTVRGGSELNRVPDTAEASGEIRAYDPWILHNGVEQILAFNGFSSIKSGNHKTTCTTKVDIIREVPSWPANQQTALLFSVWKKAASLLGMQLSTEERGGLSDGNYTWNIAPTIDGLGPHGENAHCSVQDPAQNKEQEYVSRSSFIPKVLLNTIAVLELGGLHNKK